MTSLELRAALRVGCCMLTLSLLSLARSAAAQVTFFTNQGPFVTASRATLVRFPADDQIGLSLVFQGVTVTAPNAGPTDFGGQGTWTLTYDVPPLFFASPTDPTTTAGFIAANGEDDFLLSFRNPVCSVGLYVITNATAVEKITLKDRHGNTIFDGSIDDLTAPNALAFIGIQSSVPIKTVFLDTEDGGIQNEALFEIWQGSCVH